MVKELTRKALVVDDNLRWLKTLTRLVRDIGYSISTAQSYAEALLEVEKNHVPPDLIVTDIRLRDEDESNMDGLRLLQELHDRGQLKASIVVTGYPSPETRHIAEQLGTIYLEKGNFTREDFQRRAEAIKQKPSANSSSYLQLRGCLSLAIV